MKIFVTFGQIHVHTINNKIFDKDSIAQINASDYDQGRKIACDLFGNKFCTTYTEEDVPKILHYFPRGIIRVE